MSASAGPAAVALAAAAAWLTAGPPPARSRLNHLVPQRTPGGPSAGPPGGGGARPRAPGRWTAVLSAGSAGGAAAMLLGGTRGVLAGLLLGVVLARFLTRLEPAAERRRRERVAADLPPAAELLAAAVAAGVPVEDAALAVADAVGGPVGAALREVVTATSGLGADRVTAWQSLGLRATGPRGRPDPGLAGFGRAMSRALDSGAPLARALDDIARDQRARRLSRSAEAAARVGVSAVGPLGLCFLPAFLLLGVVPLVVAVAGRVLGQLS